MRPGECHSLPLITTVIGDYHYLPPLYLFACAQVLVVDLGAERSKGESKGDGDKPAAALGGGRDRAASGAAPPMAKITWTDAQRAQAGGLLCKLAADRMHAGHVLALVKRLMPPVFLQTLADDAVRTISIFDASHENPELIWNASMRAELRTALEHLSAEALASQVSALRVPSDCHLLAIWVPSECHPSALLAPLPPPIHSPPRLPPSQRADPTAPFEVGADFVVEYPQLRDQRLVGGIYIGQLLAQPAWALRDPRAFLEALLAEWAQAREGRSPPAMLATS